MTQARVICEEETSVKKMALIDWPVASVWGIYLIDDGCGSTQLPAGGAIPGQADLGWVRKQTEQAVVSKAVSSDPGGSNNTLLVQSCDFFFFK